MHLFNRAFSYRKKWIITPMLLLAVTSYFTAQFSKPLPKYRAEAQAAWTPKDDKANPEILLKSDKIILSIAHRLGELDTMTTEKRAQTLRQLRSMLSVRNHTNSLTLAAVHTDPSKTAQIVNIWAELCQANHAAFETIQSALIPQTPINRSTPTSIAITGGILGLIFGSICAIIIEAIKPTLS